MAAMTTLSREDRNKVRQILDAAYEIVGDAQTAHEELGRLSLRQRRGLKHTEQETSQLLARFLDGPHYQAVPWSTVEMLWNYGQMATDLLEAHPMQTESEDLPMERLAPGRYRLTRQIKDSAGITVAAKSVDCNNPAYGLVQLDAWAKAMQQQLAPRRGVAA
jgi:hypothetical protein